MPEIKHYSCLIAELAFPILIFILCLAGMLSLPKEEGGEQLNRLQSGVSFFFIMLNQIAIMALFLSDYYQGFCDVYDGLCEHRKVILLVKDALG